MNVIRESCNGVIPVCRATDRLVWDTFSPQKYKEGRLHDDVLGIRWAARSMYVVSSSDGFDGVVHDGPQTGKSNESFASA